MSILGPLNDLLSGDDTPGDAQGQSGLVGMASSLLTQAGGMTGLLATLKAGGLGDEVQSWLGDGANAPVSGEQLEVALGPEKIQEVAAKLGLEGTAAANQLAAFLPGLIDKLSSGGAANEDGDVMKQVTGLLGGLLK